MKTSAGLFLTDILPHKRGLYSKIVKNKVFGKHPSHYVFDTLKKSGVDGVEVFLPSFSKITANVIEELKEHLNREKMEALSLHQSLRFFTKTKLAEIEHLFEYAKILGAKVIVLHVSLAGSQIFKKEYIDTIHRLQEQYGIKVGFENKEKVIGTRSKNKFHWHQEEFPKLMKKNNFYITLDTTHLAQAGGDIIKFFKEHKDSIINIHLSDYKHHFLNSTLRPFRFKHMPLGKGHLPIQQFLEVLYKEKYKGLVTMEIHTDLDGMCESARVINYLRDLEGKNPQKRESTSKRK